MGTVIQNLKGRLEGFIFDYVAYINEVGIFIILFNEVYYTTWRD